tara:strand:- start:5231 stop:6055 length:825 start_codon:yes stop_codon:yes gene_type:complete
MKTLLTRSISGLIFVVLVVLSLTLEPLFFLAFFSVIVGIGLFEFHKLFSGKNQLTHSWSVTVILGYISFLSLVLPSYLIYNFSLNPLWFILAVLLFYGLLQVLIYKNTTSSIFLFLGAIMYVVIPFYLAFEIHIKDTGTLPIILGVFLLVWTNDTFAYLSGNIVGKHKLYEKVSPNKTWEGFAGGFAFAIIMGFILDQYVYVDAGYAPCFWVKSAIFIAPAAVAGDLFQSALKRKMKVKDTGNIMPGHGGILDRFDAMLFALPVFYILLYFDVI